MQLGWGGGWGGGWLGRVCAGKYDKGVIVCLADCGLPTVQLYEAAEEYEHDFVLVCYDETTYSAAQSTRDRLLRGDFAHTRQRELTAEVRLLCGGRVCVWRGDSPFLLLSSRIAFVGGSRVFFLFFCLTPTLFTTRPPDGLDVSMTGLDASDDCAVPQCCRKGEFGAVCGNLA